MPFKKGQSGNPRGRRHGVKEKHPRTFRALMASVVTDQPAVILAAMQEGLAGKQSHKYLGILAQLEKQQHEHSGPDGGPMTTKVLFEDAP